MFMDLSNAFCNVFVGMYLKWYCYMNRLSMKGSQE